MEHWEKEMVLGRLTQVWSVAMYCNAMFCIPRSNCPKTGEFSWMPAFVVQTFSLNLKLVVNKEAYNL